MVTRPWVIVASCAALAVTLVPSAGAAGPVITYSVRSGTAGDSGWYRSDVTADLQIQNATDTSCPSVKTFRTSSEALDCTATDGTSTVAFHLQFKIDKDAPTVTGASPDRGANGNGWYASPVTVKFNGSDGSGSGITSCQQVSYSGPDNGDANVSGTCRDVAGNVSAASNWSLKYDATPPSVTAAPARKPDANGWYNHALPVAFTGSDTTSGIDGCSSASYAGPDNASASVGGTCTDKAGNTGNGSFGLKFDSTPPKLARVTIVTGNQKATVRWQASPDTVTVLVTRLAKRKGKLVYRGKHASFTDARLTNGLRYRYTVVGIDVAGNRVAKAVFAVPRALTAPTEGQKVKRAPMLAWAAVPKAAYYNVQLYRGRVKVLSLWPHTTKLRLPRSWRFGGTSYTLAPGRYRWYVWPGFGPRQQSKYGKLLGGSFFFVVR
jgi:hypothetical protein